MKRYAILLLSLTAILLLSGCSLIITDRETATLEPGAPGQPVETVEVATPPATEPVEEPTEEASESNLQPVTVEHAQVEIGVGSPIPVTVQVAGTWPGLCSQLAEVTQSFNGEQIEINILADPGPADCPPDNVGVSFSMGLPINIVELPRGSGAYNVNVNGFSTSFEMPAESGSDAEPGAMGELTPIPVQNVQVEIGVGSPIPVTARVSGEWPGLCAQLAQINQSFENITFTVELLADSGRADCPPDQLGLPFAIGLPINPVELGEGSFTVTVNGSSATFDVPLEPNIPIDPGIGDGSTPEPEEGASAVLCPDVPRPALALFVPGQEYIIMNPLSGEECATTLQGDLPGLFQAAADGVYYTSLENDTFAVKRIDASGASSVLEFTGVPQEEALLFHSFVVSDDGSRLAWSAAGPAEGNSGVPASRLWVASISGEDVVMPLPVYEPGENEQRALVPVRFSADNSTLFYTLQPVGLGGSWHVFTGRYDNLYALRLNSDAPPTLIFDCAELEMLLCIGDFYEVAGEVGTLAYVQDGSVIIINGAGEVLNTLTPDAEYVAYPTFGPGGELAFYSAELADDSIQPEAASIHRVAPPTAPDEVLVSDPGLLFPQGWLDDTHIVTGYTSGLENWGTAIVGLDGTLEPIDAYPNASYVDTIP